MITEWQMQMITDWLQSKYIVENSKSKGGLKMSNGTKSFKFINPYNFIPMGKNVSKYKYSQDEEKLSGVIE